MSIVDADRISLVGVPDQSVDYFSVHSSIIRGYDVALVVEVLGHF